MINKTMAAITLASLILVNRIDLTVNGVLITFRDSTGFFIDGSTILSIIMVLWCLGVAAAIHQLSLKNL